MEKKYTFWELLQQYDKIEIPIIQRDYAQGRENNEAKRIREKFVEDVLVNSVIESKKVELDFVYGALSNSKSLDFRTEEVFIPLDGQQRLTTLFLLHYFIALKEERLKENLDLFRRFTYETRPTAHNFILHLLEDFEIVDLRNIEEEIIDAPWYDDNWKLDSTISGFIKILSVFASNRGLVESENNLFEKLTKENSDLISFYFVHLEKFGMSEDLYIRMNARGKMLTNFENFKSEFFKIIKYDHELLEQFKEKIEYKWVESLWSYRLADSFVIDNPFMNYLQFITEMLYFKKGDFKDSDFIKDFLSFKVLNEIYSDKENLEFLVFSLDFLEDIQELESSNWLWNENSSIQNIFKLLLTGEKVEVTHRYLLFGTLLYFRFNNQKTEDYFDFIRVLRNLVVNTNDTSRREWPRIISSIQKMIGTENIYIKLLEEKFIEGLEGFYSPQRKQEKLKAEIIKRYGIIAKSAIFRVEEIECLEGNIEGLLKLSVLRDDQEFLNISLDNFNFDNFDSQLLLNYANAYSIIAKDSFKFIWGHLIDSNLYEHSISAGRLTYKHNHEQNEAFFTIAKVFYDKTKCESLECFLLQRDKEYVKNAIDTYSDLSMISDPKKQLQLYYFIHKYINKQENGEFFRAGYNFGWLERKKEYLSNFKNGVQDCPWFSKVNPIFQTYDYQFRYNLGLNINNVICPEIKNCGYKASNLKKLVEWANS